MEHKISFLIIDSEPKSFNQIQEILNENSLVGKVDFASDSETALVKIIDSNPDIILMEFPFKDSSVNELYKFFKTKLTETTIVFVSESRDNAVQAIQNGIYHYLLKPIAKDKINKIIGQVRLIKQNSVQHKIKSFIEKSTEEKRMMFYTSKGYILIDPEEIIFCKADGIFSEMYLIHNRKEIIFLFLSRIEEMLGNVDFIRSGRKYLINKRYIRKIYKNNNSILLFHDGNEYLVKASKHQIRNLSKLNID
jgi:DNA-binding LytR/AlgR family response regulator